MEIQYKQNIHPYMEEKSRSAAQSVAHLHLNSCFCIYTRFAQKQLIVRWIGQWRLISSSCSAQDNIPQFCVWEKKSRIRIDLLQSDIPTCFCILLSFPIPFCILLSERYILLYAYLCYLPIYTVLSWEMFCDDYQPRFYPDSVLEPEHIITSIQTCRIFLYKCSGHWLKTKIFYKEHSVRIPNSIQF